MPCLVDFFLYGKLAESRERQRQEWANSSVQDGEGLTQSAVDFFRRAYSRSGIGYSPVGRQSQLDLPGQVQLSLPLYRYAK
jgi:hypothetical protein